MEMALQSTPTHRQTGSSNVLGLTDIFAPEAQITVVQRSVNSVIDAYLADAAQHMGEGFRVVLKSGERLPHHLFPARSGREDFVADIDYLAEIYGDLLGCPSVGLRVEVLARAMCPRFHVDATGIRLLCTYRGSGTEWLDDRYADRSKLGSVSDRIDDEHSGIILNPAGVHRVATYDIALLKGSRWQGNAGRGIIHRSPAVSDESAPRVLLALDALW